MIKQESISIITKTGTVIITTLLSFAITPPAISAEDAVIKWQNVFVFVSGVLSVFFYNWVKDKIKSKTLGFVLIGMLVILLIIYEIMVNKFSVSCFSGRVVISSAAVKKEVKPKLEFWLSHKDLNNKDPYTNLVSAYQCSSIRIWNFEDLYARYYGLLSLYFFLIIILTIIIVFISDLIVGK